MQQSRRRIVLPIAILSFGVLAVIAILSSRDPVIPRPPGALRPLVRTTVVQPEQVQFIVEANGTVTPSTASDLMPQVSGEVVWLTPVFAPGGFFKKGEPLLRIDRADYEVSLESARANVAAAESEFARARKERTRQRQLADRSISSEARIDDAENAYRVARARLREARAKLERARRDIDRTEILAPYDGRVRSENVDVGQFVSRGSPIARLYAVDFAEVRLPLPDRELAYLDIALDYRDVNRTVLDGDGIEETLESGQAVQTNTRDLEVDGTRARNAGRSGQHGPRVVLTTEFAGATHAWEGQIIRTEGEIDPKSRMVHVVARVSDPYGRSSDIERPPLAVGLFVHADILGRVVEDAFVIPRSALRDWEGLDRDQVLVVDAESRIEFRDVEVLRSERDRVIVGAGLEPGERVCISPLRAVTNGMFVDVADPVASGVDFPEVGS